MNNQSNQPKSYNSSMTEKLQNSTSSMSSLISALNKNCNVREREVEPISGSEQSEEAKLASVLVNMRNSTLSPSRSSRSSSRIGSNSSFSSFKSSSSSSSIDRWRGRTNELDDRSTTHRYNTRNGTFSSSSSSSSTFPNEYSDPIDSLQLKRRRIRIGSKNKENNGFYKSATFPLSKSSLLSIPPIPEPSSPGQRSVLQSALSSVPSLSSNSEGLQGNGRNALQESPTPLPETESPSDRICFMSMTDSPAGGDRMVEKKEKEEGGISRSSPSAPQSSLNHLYNVRPVLHHPAEIGYA